MWPEVIIIRIISTFFPSTFLSLHILFSSPHLIIFCLPLFPDRCPTLQLFISSYISIPPYLHISICHIYLHLPAIAISPFAISPHPHLPYRFIVISRWPAVNENVKKLFQCDVETATGVYSCLSLDMQVIQHFLSHTCLLKYCQKFWRNTVRREEIRIFVTERNYAFWHYAQQQTKHSTHWIVCHFPRNIHICDEDERFNISICFGRKIWESSIVKVLIGERLLKFEA